MHLQAVTKARNSLSEVRKQVSSWAEKMPHITDSEKEDLLKVVDKADQWISDKLEAQAATSPFETPAFDSTEVAPQLKSVTALLEKLLKKPKPAPVVPEKVRVCMCMCVMCVMVIGLFVWIVWMGFLITADNMS